MDVSVSSLLWNIQFFCCAKPEDYCQKKSYKFKQDNYSFLLFWLDIINDSVIVIHIRQNVMFGKGWRGKVFISKIVALRYFSPVCSLSCKFLAYFHYLRKMNYYARNVVYVWRGCHDFFYKCTFSSNFFFMFDFFMEISFLVIFDSV